MIAFISYSINESEQYVLTLLAQKLREKGFSVTSNYKQASQLLDFQTINAIKSADLFIGLVAASGNPTSTVRVYSELNQAFSHNRPAILLAEESVELLPHIKNYPNTIRFNRYYPNLAIEEVNRRIKFSQAQPQQDNTLAWLIGGGIAAVALISLLSDEKR
jgi:hypothetical protein